MRRVGMLFRGVVCGVAILSLLFTFSVPAAHAQMAADATVQVKIQGNIKVFDGDDKIDTEKGKVKAPGILRTIGANGFGGFDYDINALDDTGPGVACGEINVGTLSTRGSDELTALGDYLVTSVDFSDLPTDTELFGDFNAKVKFNKDDELVKAISKGATAEFFDTAAGETLGYGKKTTITLKKKEFDNLAKKFDLECDDPT